MKLIDIDGTVLDEFGTGVDDPLLMILDDYNYNWIEYDNYAGEGDKKKIIGKTRCCFVENKNREKNVIPRVLVKLLQARSDAKKRMKKYDKSEFMYSVT